MREVVFLGLAKHDAPRGRVLASAEVWTMNDWYQFYPWLAHPSRVYQIHEKFNLAKATSNRFTGDWRGEYEKSGAEIVTLSQFGFTRERMIDKVEIAWEFGSGFFGSTFSYMFAEAIREKVDKIQIHGIRLAISAEYERQVPVTLLNIKTARARGIQVECEREKEWIASGAKPAEYKPIWVDWKNLKGVDLMYGAKANTEARRDYEQVMYGALP